MYQSGTMVFCRSDQSETLLRPPSSHLALEEVADVMELHCSFSWTADQVGQPDQLAVCGGSEIFLRACSIPLFLESE